ncbi:MAG: molybdenum cofactor guanylyltransferase MobA [Pseudomonadota bacterium]
MPAFSEGNAVTGLILAGGRGTRMGAADKGLQQLHGMPLVCHAVQRLRGQVGEILISANRNHATYAHFNIPLVKDAIDGFQGPLAGLQSGMMHCQTPYLMTVPCDTPFFPLDLVQRLMEGLLHEQADLAIVMAGDDACQQIQPLFCLTHVRLLPNLSAFLQQGGRGAGRWAATVGAAQVCFNDHHAFVNINTIEMLNYYENAGDHAINSGIRGVD